MRPNVFKFGGVAVGSADAIRRAVVHVRAAAPNVAVVVSAMNGVTDLLLDAGQAALGGERARCEAAVAEFETRHFALIDEVIGGRDAAERLRETIGAAAHEMRSMTESIAVLRELTPRTQDALVARGERAVAAIFAAALEESGIAAAYIDATEIIHTERRFGALWPDLGACERHAKKTILPLLANRVVVVMPGYIATGPDGSLVTLGRGGSDFSAAIVARSTGAEKLTLFKEVDGLMTADPKSVPDARVIAEMHYREAAELAYYGAKVLHPRTMIPLVDRRIPLLVRNTFHDGAGTRIAGDVKSGAYPVKALTAIHGQALIAIEGKGMTGIPGVAGQAFTALSEAGHSVSMISQASSESSICFVVPQPEAQHAVAALERAFQFERKVHLIDRITAQSGVALIAVVGLGMRGHAGIAARTFSAISAAGVNIIAIAQGSSELNITVAVAEKDATAALRALHDEYQLHKVRPLAQSGGREAALTLLGFGQIGRELARQIVAQQPHLRGNVDLKITGVADRSGVRIDENGFSPTALQRFAKQKKAGTPFQGQSFDALWPLPSYRPIFVDLTSDETGELLAEAMGHGFNIVLANKKPLAGPQEAFDRLIAMAQERGLSLRYEATAGAGLPVLDTIAKLQQAGDKIETIVGCFSGTLGYILTELEKGVAFSDAVRKAQELGYTEPDPRDDLSGMDVARKALILARTLGHRAELSEIRLQPLEFSDDEFRDRIARAKREKRVLRYVAKIRSRSISVGLEALPESSPAANLRGTDNQVAIYSKRYSANPLVVTGPGAGATVTAAGVLNDIVAIAIEEKRRRAR
ncbi:MAG TPA: bifunctional aspartate kinase/homoserine dehydrogenase I [Thermoanaerobaculia bacterium]|nr:bifunctional aspartate kinase/homoserine dehydrogenase I [Thermoanaerobaculia bacterium]